MSRSESANSVPGVSNAPNAQTNALSTRASTYSISRRQRRKRRIAMASGEAVKSTWF